MEKKNFKERLVEVASEIFVRFGFNKATMEDIAKAAGKKKSTLYYYFKGKEEIFQAVLEKEAKGFRDTIYNEIVAQPLSPEEKLRGYVLQRLAFLSGFGNYYAFVMSSESGAFTNLESVRKQFDKEEEELIAAIADEGIQQGLFRLSDKHFAARALLTIIKGFEMAVFVSKVINIEELEERVNELLDILLYGLLLDSKLDSNKIKQNKTKQNKIKEDDGVS